MVSSCRILGNFVFSGLLDWHHITWCFRQWKVKNWRRVFNHTESTRTPSTFYVQSTVSCWNYRMKISKRWKFFLNWDFIAAFEKIRINAVHAYNFDIHLFLSLCSSLVSAQRLIPPLFLFVDSIPPILYAVILNFRPVSWTDRVVCQAKVKPVIWLGCFTTFTKAHVTYSSLVGL